MADTFVEEMLFPDIKGIVYMYSEGVGKSFFFFFFLASSIKKIRLPVWKK